MVMMMTGALRRVFAGTTTENVHRWPEGTVTDWCSQVPPPKTFYEGSHDESEEYDDESEEYDDGEMVMMMKMKR